MRGRDRLRALVAGVVLVATVLTGCASIPDSGPVQEGDPITADVPSDVVYTPKGPVADSSQERILRDFISAGTGPQDNYAVAREYLSAGFADAWDARASVTVRPGGGATTRVGEDELEYAFTATATLDGGGHYVPATTSVPTSLGYSFVQEDGQWRISDAPDGTVLNPATFQSIFRAHAVYFYDPSFRYLVPDQRWFLARSSTSTRIASALLDGPSTWLQGAVVSAFPEGTQLSLTAITVDDGTARVDLTSDALSASDTARARMQAQLLASFSTLSTITAVDLSVESTVLDVPDLGGAAPLRDPTVDARPLVVADGVLGFASRSSVSPLPGLGPVVGALAPTSAEASADLSVVVVGTDRGALRVGADGSSLLVDGRAGLAPPTLDDAGWVWSVPVDDARAVTATGADGVPHAVTSTLPAGSAVVAFRVSRDGARALVLLDDQGESRLLVVALLRDSRGVPTALGPPVELAAPTGRPVDATWADQLTVASLTDTGEGSLVSLAEVGGASAGSGQPSGSATTIVGGNGSSSLRVLTAEGSVLEPRGSSWQDTGVVADLLATQR
ncbi:GerMN domain-containing protein [Frigoribacterium sp. CFBP 13729]|uniref:LpqB family beta-propeller domain-containing protein n=1 Tax=Frigoribacterium sp. CFBP 13729 TaxID=2775293 RepID=UPI00177AB950|nr:GerMN domain-containing protein [Frigoribacterium sp. CFBP 13729]